ncbi:MAG: hypothetical protein NTW14_14485 [bacterium]|nr:hypothetical protein [bacterium]
MRKKLSFLYILIIGISLVFYLSGCAVKRVYLLDQPVSDPVMYADDAEDSDLCKVEDGGYSGSAGECPT